MIEECIFCKIIKGDVPAERVAETDELIAIKDINPKAPHHYLIIPKKHIVDLRSFQEEDMALGGKMFSLAQKISKDLGDIAFRLVISNGYDAGQRIDHLHMHFLAGRAFED
jgi:histidine triad (HIT) family protein